MKDASGMELLQKITTFRYDNNGNELRRSVEYVSLFNKANPKAYEAAVYGNDTTESIHAVVDQTVSIYDGFNRMIKSDIIKAKTRNVVEYAYNGDGLRVQKTVRRSDKGNTLEVTGYLYDRQHVILETRENNSISYARGLNYIGRTDNTGTLSYFLFNGHGDVVQTVSEAGEIENQYDYDIFGNPILTVENYLNSIRYAGEFYDTETGLYYLRARYYDPYIGRFVSEDSYWGEDNNPLSLNMYTYAHNDPLKYIDPTGHRVETNSGGSSKPKATSSSSKSSSSKSRSSSSKSSASISTSKAKTSTSYSSYGSKSSANKQSTSSYTSKPSVTKPSVSSNSTGSKSSVGSTASKPSTAKQNTSSFKANKFSDYSSTPSSSKAKSNSGVNASSVKSSTTSRPETKASSIMSSAKPTVKSVLKNFGGGVLDAGKDAVKGVVSVAKHPVQTAKALGNAALHPVATGKAIVKGAATSFKENVVNGDANTRARFAGKLVGDIALSVASTKGLDKVAKIAKGADAAADTARLAKTAAKYSDDVGKAAAKYGDDAAAVAAKSGNKAAGQKMDLQLFAEKKAGNSGDDIAKGAGKGKTPGPTVDGNTGKEVGRFIGDDKGNVMIEPVGGKTVPAGKGGVDTHTTYPNGSNYQRLNPEGHGNNPTAHGHGHLEGTGPGMKGQGPSIDVNGNTVPWNSSDAHWPIIK